MKRRELAGEIVAMSLATGSTMTEAARKAGVGVRTVHTWMQRPDFQKKVRAMRTEILDRAAGKMANIITCSIDTLRALLSSENDHVKLGAARTVQENALKFYEAMNLEERLRKLEEGDAQDTDQEAGGAGPASTEPGTSGDPVRTTP